MVIFSVKDESIKRNVIKEKNPNHKYPAILAKTFFLVINQINNNMIDDGIINNNMSRRRNINQFLSYLKYINAP